MTTENQKAKTETANSELNISTGSAFVCHRHYKGDPKVYCGMSVIATNREDAEAFLKQDEPEYDYTFQEFPIWQNKKDNHE